MTKLKTYKEKKAELKGKIHKSAIIFGNFNTSLSRTESCSRKKISKNREKCTIF